MSDPPVRLDRPVHVSLHLSADDDGILTARIRGEISSYFDVEEFHSWFEPLTRPGVRLVLDLTEFTFITTPGISALIRLNRAVERKGGKLALFGAQHHVEKVFKLVRLDTVIFLSAEREPAVNHLLSNEEDLDPRRTFLLDLHKAILKEATTLLKGEEGLVALFVTGSVASRDADRFSNIDLHLVCEDDRFDELLDRRAELAARISPPLVAFDALSEDRPVHVALIPFGRDLVQLDLVFERTSALRSHRGEAESPIILFDLSDGAVPEAILADIRDLTHEERAVRHAEIVERFLYLVFHTAGRFARGELWVTIQLLHEIRTLLIDLWQITPRLNVRGYRKLEKLLPPGLLEPLARTAPLYDPASIKFALTSLIDLFYAEATRFAAKHQLDFPEDRYRLVREYFDQALVGL